MHTQDPSHQAAATAATRATRPRRANRVIAAAIAAAGGQRAIAERCGVTRQAVSDWLYRGRVPVQYVNAVCALGDHVITVDQLCAAVAQEAAGACA
ncbi:MAG: carph-isopro domain-containing protein [bacterium]|jgi:hypothetical protein